MRPVAIREVFTLGAGIDGSPPHTCSLLDLGVDPISP